MTSLKGHILATYESIDPHTEMSKYFKHIEPLLNAIAARCMEFQIV